jgi:anti-sigma factor RsiW
MRTRSIMPADCARACQQLSLRLDSELSEFEIVLLEAHLRRCDACRAFGEAITGLTDTLRTGPVERPTVSFQAPRSRTRVDALFTGALRVGSAAAAVAVVALGGLIALNSSPSGAPAAAELDRVRGVLSVHERQLREMDGFTQARRAEVPRGLEAAEPVALRVAKSSRRLQGRR